MSKCFAPDCLNEGTHFPVIRFGHEGCEDLANAPYRLEVPRLVCPAHQDIFHPAVFFTDLSRTTMSEAIVMQGHPAPDFANLRVDWVDYSDPVYVELVHAGGSEARLWWG